MHKLPDMVGWAVGKGKEFQACPVVILRTPLHLVCGKVELSNINGEIAAKLKTWPNQHCKNNNKNFNSKFKNVFLEDVYYSIL